MSKDEIFLLLLSTLANETSGRKSAVFFKASLLNPIHSSSLPDCLKESKAARKENTWTLCFQLAYRIVDYLLCCTSSEGEGNQKEGRWSWVGGVVNGFRGVSMREWRTWWHHKEADFQKLGILRYILWLYSRWGVTKTFLKSTFAQNLRKCVLYKEAVYISLYCQET